jgi:hypothetical protein
VEQKAQLTEEANIRACHTGPMPEPDIKMEDIPDLGNIEEEDDEEPEEPYTGEDVMEDGDCLFTMMIPCKGEFIHASLNILQHLAEPFHKNITPKTFHESVPTHLHNFEDLSKSSFDCLPDHKIWDHTIELVPNGKASNCKVYPLSLNEQAELDMFIQENLASGCIWPLKSPMVSPVFFIKKKDGLLHLVQVL